MFSPRLRKRGRSASTSPPARPHATSVSPSSSSCSSVEVAFRRHASSSGEGILPLHPLSKTSPTTLNTKARTGKKNRTKTEPPPLLGNSTKGGSFRLRKNVSIDPSCLVEPPAQPGGDAPLLIAATPPPKRPPLTISQQRQQQPAQQQPKQSTVPTPQSPTNATTTTPVLLPPLLLPSQTPPPQTPSPLSSRKGFARETLPGTVRPHSMGNLHKLKFQEVLHSVATSPQVVTNSVQPVPLSSVRQEQQQTSSRKAATKKKKKQKSGSKILPAGQYAMQRNPTTGDLYYVYSPSPPLPLASDALRASSTEPRDVPKDRLSYSGILQSATSQFISAEEGIEPIPSDANELCEETALHLPLTESFASVLTSYALSVNSSEPASARSSKRGSIKRQSSSFFYDAWSSPSENTSSSSETDSGEQFYVYFLFLNYFLFFIIFLPFSFTVFSLSFFFSFFFRFSFFFCCSLCPLVSLFVFVPTNPAHFFCLKYNTNLDEDFMLDPSWVVDEDELAFRRAWEEKRRKRKHKQQHKHKQEQSRNEQMKEQPHFKPSTKPKITTELREQEKEREIEKERELQRLLRLSVGLKPKLDKQKTVEEENKAHRGKHSASNEVKVVNPLYAKNLHKRVASMDTHNSHSSDADLEHSSRSSSSDTRHVRVCIDEVSRGRSRTRNEIGKYGSLRERGFSTVKCEPEEERRIDREEYNALFSASSHVTSLTRTNTGRSRSLSPGRKRDKIPRQENEQQKWGKKKKKKKEKNRKPHGIRHKTYNYKEPRNSWKEAATSLWLIEHEPPQLAGVKTHDGVFVDQQINREWKGTRKEEIRKQEYVENEEEKIKEAEEEEEEEKEEEGEDDIVSAAILLKKYFPSNSPRQHLVNNSSDGVDITKRDIKSDAVTKQAHSCRTEAGQELSLEVSGRSESACIPITCSSVTVAHSDNLNECTNHSRNAQSFFSETLTHPQKELGAEQLADWRQKEQQWHKEKKEMEARISKIRLKYLALKEKCRGMKDTDDTRSTTAMQEDCTVVISNGHSEKKLSKPDCSHCQEKDETIQKLLALFAELNCINAKAQALVRNKESEHSCE
ncbi:Dynein heavy chain [Balamuthia mandrillaris]